MPGDWSFLPTDAEALVAEAFYSGPRAYIQYQVVRDAITLLSQGSGAGSGDMLKSTYDPLSVNDDAFDMANMAEAADAKIMTSAERTKLTGIETAATADQTASEILAALLTVDGAASLLDADLLDGVEGSAFLLETELAAGAITAAPGALDFSGGSTGHVLTKQADGSIALQAQAAGRSTTVGDANTTIVFNDSLDNTHRLLTAGTAIAITLDAQASVGTVISAISLGAGTPTVTPEAGATYKLPGDTSGRTAAFEFDIGKFEVIENSDSNSAVWTFIGNSNHSDLADNALDMNGEQITNAKAPYPASEITASRSLTLADANQKKLVGNHATVAIDLTVEPDSTTDFPDGTVIPIARKGAAAVNIVAGSGVTVNKPSDKQLSLRAQYSEGVLWKEITNIWWFTGDQTPV